LRALADSPLAFSTTHAEARERADPWWRDAARRGAAGDGWVTFVAERQGALIGMASGHFPDEALHVLDDAKIASLMQMWVDPTARRGGVGRRLVDAVAAWARERGSPVLRLGVTASEQGAVAFYRAIGFRDTGRRDMTIERLGPVIEMERQCRT
jgi:ribosomal protein S18 acetylase RimI-like enzyme